MIWSSFFAVIGTVFLDTTSCSTPESGLLAKEKHAFYHQVNNMVAAAQGNEILTFGRDLNVNVIENSLGCKDIHSSNVYEARNHDGLHILHLVWPTSLQFVTLSCTRITAGRQHIYLNEIKQRPNTFLLGDPILQTSGILKLLRVKTASPSKSHLFTFSFRNKKRRAHWGNSKKRHTETSWPYNQRTIWLKKDIKNAVLSHFCTNRKH